MTDNDRDFLQKIVRQMVFVPSISITELITAILEYEEGRKRYINIINDVNDRIQYNSKILKRVRTIMSRLSVDGDTSKTALELTETSKRYGQHLFQQQIMVYNKTAKLLNVNPITMVLDSEQLKCIIESNSDKVDYNLISIYYPYYVWENKKGFSFLEFILIFGIYFATERRGLDTLCKTIQTPADRKRADALVDKVTNVLSNERVYKIFIDMFFYTFYDWINDDKTVFSMDYYRNYWLSEKYKKRKDLFRVIGNHAEFQYHGIIDGDDIIEKQIIGAKLERSMDYERVEEVVLPLAWEIMISSHPTNGKIKRNTLKFDNLYEENLLDAKKYVSVIRSLIRNSINGAKQILFFSLE